ncbi:hypothetical protein STCU_04520 [Strigomonas culicis]|uniref:Uncharacterized protein n=1 Tax=Strigomonas culicis TaxID=28005 RepID=S9VQW0_9TRYP|nr:hypothetical protein STCU_04520 [Strigomonas culicis]|eukprot:EPY29501.1 hypothetical protein STCU_04520 [Strigomonas culicis]
MVFFVVKGTKFPDEFVVERKLTDVIDIADEDGPAGAADRPPTVAQTVCHIQNMRHRVRLLLLSAQELLREMEEGKYTPPPLAEGDRPAALQAYVDALYAQLKDAKALVADDAYDAAAARLTAWTARLYPALCTHADGEAAAITALYNLLEDPDVEEDRRLRIYHCRALLDPQWKHEECQAEATAALWFCGKRMVGTAAAYAGRNEKSRLTVKVAAREGPAPSGEPRMHYDDQRALYQRMREKRETFKQLEESELRERVLRQVRAANVVAPAAVSEAARTSVNTAQLRPIYARKTETTTDA